MAPFLVRLARVFSPRPKRDPNEIRICYASGLPKTHPSLLRHVVGEKGYVNQKSTFVRHDEADARELIQITRRALYEKAVEAGGNAIIKESWVCNVKDRAGLLIIRVRYRGLAVVATQIDPQEPVSIEEADFIADSELQTEVEMSQRRSSEEDYSRTTPSYANSPTSPSHMAPMQDFYTTRIMETKVRAPEIVDPNIDERSEAVHTQVM